MTNSKELPEFYALEAMKFGGRVQISGNGKAFTDVDNFNPVALKNLLSDANLGRICQSLGLDEAKLREAVIPRQEKVCEWAEDDQGVWETNCGESYMFEDGGPTDNGCKYCCFCGFEIGVSPYEFEPEEDFAALKGQTK